MKRIHPIFIQFISVIVLLTIVGLMVITLSPTDVASEAVIIPSPSEIDVITRRQTPNTKVVLEAVAPEQKEQVVQWRGGRYNTAAGFSVELPTGSRITESEEDPILENGLIRKVSVVGVNGKILFEARLLSSGAGVKVSDGCCEYFGHTLDLAASDRSIIGILEKDFRKIFAFERITVGSNAAVGFYATWEYAEGELQKHLVVPVNDAQFTSLHFMRTVGKLWSVESPLPNLSENNVRVYASSEAEREFQDVMSTVQLISLPAQ